MNEQIERVPPAWSRRRALQFGSSTLAALLAGCSTSSDGAETDTMIPPVGPASTEPGTATGTPDPCRGVATVTPIEERRQRGAAPPISVERTVVRNYHENTFEEWAETECAHVAGEAVLERLVTRLDDATGIGYGVGSDSQGKTVLVDHSIMLTRCGRIARRPAASFEAYVDATPSTVDVTLHVELPGEDRDYSCSHEPLVYHYALRQW